MNHYNFILFMTTIEKIMTKPNGFTIIPEPPKVLLGAEQQVFLRPASALERSEQNLVSYAGAYTLSIPPGLARHGSPHAGVLLLRQNISSR
jgi:hypothetical protein